MNGRTRSSCFTRCPWPAGLALCLLLAGPAPAALCAQPQDAAEPPAAKTSPAKPTTQSAGSKPAAKARKARRSSKPAPTTPEQPRLTAQELQNPYTALGGADNATRLAPFDPTPTARPFAPAEQDLGLKLRLGREQVLDPLTGQEVTPKADAAGAKESLKKMDVKGAVDKLGGKAEVQVEILKF